MRAATRIRKSMGIQGVMWVVVVVSLLVLIDKESFSEEMFEISGEVLDLHDGGIDKVIVEASRGNNVYRDETKITGKGKYSVKFPGGAKIDLVTYSHSDYNIGNVPDLSGKRDHSIKKVLKPLGSQLSYTEALEGLTTLEMIFYRDASRGVPLAEVRGRYEPILRQMKIPGELAERRRAVLQLYGIGR